MRQANDREEPFSQGGREADGLHDLVLGVLVLLEDPVQLRTECYKRSSVFMNLCL